MNEWDWAIANSRRLILLLIEPCEIPFHYVSRNYIDPDERSGPSGLLLLPPPLTRLKLRLQLPRWNRLYRIHRLRSNPSPVR